MNALNRSKSSGSSRRGRSREPRNSYDDDDDDNSFESYESASDDQTESSYETESDRHIGYKESTEYESDHGSYSSRSEPQSPTDDYSDDDDDDDESIEEDANIVSMDSQVDSGISTSGDSFGEESSDDEDSFGEFNTNKVQFGTKKNDPFGNDDDDDESDFSNSQSGSEDEEPVKLGKQDDEKFWKRYGYSQQVGQFGSDQNMNDDDDDDDDDDDESSDGRTNSRTKSGSEFDDGDTFKDELYQQAFPSIARMRTEDSREEIDDPERSFNNNKKDYIGNAKNWIQSKWPLSKDNSSSSNRNSRNNSRSPKRNSWFDFSDVMQGNFKWYIIGGVLLIILIIILGSTIPKKDKKPKNVVVASKQPTPVIAADIFPSASPTISAAPTLPEGQILQSFSFYVMIPNGKGARMTEETLENELLTAFGYLAPQILLNTTTEPSNNNTTDTSNNTTNQTETNDSVGLRGRRRKLKALSVKSPIYIDTVTIDCPELPSIDEFDLCAKATVEIVVITDDGTIGFDYSTAIEDAINGGELETVSTEFGSNTTIVALNADDIVTPAPTMTFSPTMSPAPTISAAPTSSCYDRDVNCETWANQDPSECVVNPEYMTVNCPKSCGLCVTDSPTTRPTAAPTMNTTIAPSSNSTIDATTNSTLSGNQTLLGNQTTTNSTLSGNQTLAPSTNSTAAPIGNETTIAPTSSNTMQPPTTAPKLCDDKNDACEEFVDGIGCLVTKCTLWASQGECENNPTYMVENCANACNACDSGPTTESPTPTNVDPPTPVGCSDKNFECPSWAEEGECSKNPGWMLANCALSCDSCDDGDGDDNEPTPTCVDSDNRCPEWAAADECLKNPVWMGNNCKLSCGGCQSQEAPSEDTTSDNGDDTNGNSTNEDFPDDYMNTDPGDVYPEDYMNTDPGAYTDPGEDYITCNDSNDRCPEWAEKGECMSNPTWMLANCQKSCNACTSTEQRSSITEGSSITSSQVSSSISTPIANAQECKDLKDGCHETSESGDCLLTKCAFWASEGECLSNPSYMNTNCAQSCGQCMSV